MRKMTLLALFAILGLTCQAETFTVNGVPLGDQLVVKHGECGAVGVFNNGKSKAIRTPGGATWLRSATDTNLLCWAENYIYDDFSILRIPFRQFVCADGDTDQIIGTYLVADLWGFKGTKEEFEKHSTFRVFKALVTVLQEKYGKPEISKKSEMVFRRKEDSFTYLWKQGSTEICLTVKGFPDLENSSDPLQIERVSLHLQYLDLDVCRKSKKKKSAVEREHFWATETQRMKDIF